MRKRRRGVDGFLTQCEELEKGIVRDECMLHADRDRGVLSLCYSDGARQEVSLTDWDEKTEVGNQPCLRCRNKLYLEIDAAGKIDLFCDACGAKHGVAGGELVLVVD